MTSDSTLIAVAAITAGSSLLASLVGGFVGGRMQRRIQEQAHEEEHRQHRQGVYHNLLNYISRIDLTVTALSSRAEPEVMARVESASLSEDFLKRVGEDLRGLLDALRSELNGLLLFGSWDVRRAAEKLDALLAPGEAKLRFTLLLWGWWTEPMPDEIGEAWKEVVATEEWEPALEGLRAAMRLDVAPEPRRWFKLG